MSQMISDLLPLVKQNKPVSDELLTQLNTQLETNLPIPYEDVLRSSNGLEGPIDEKAYIILWPTEDLIKYNQAYAVEEFAPNLFLIGSDGSETAYGLDLRNSSSTYGSFVTVPFIGMDWKEAQVLSPTFVGFIAALKKHP